MWGADHGAFLVLDLGVEDYDVSLEKQQVLVTGTIPYDDLLEKIKKTGKEVSISLSFVVSICCF